MKAIEGMKMDRKDISFSGREAHRKEERDYWLKASVEEKIAMITYLQECFYGAEATTGRLQRVFEFSKHERC